MSMDDFDFSVLTESQRDYYRADWMHEKLMENISEFQDELDDEHEVGLMLANFGTSKLMSVHNVGFQNPNMIYLYGTVNGQESQLIQHTSQLNFLLTAVPKSDPEKPPRRIGIVIPNED